MTSHQFTPDQIVDTIEHALRERDLYVIPGLIKLLALQDPKRAQDVFDTIQAGIAISRGDDIEVVLRPVRPP